MTRTSSAAATTSPTSTIHSAAWMDNRCSSTSRAPTRWQRNAVASSTYRVPEPCRRARASPWAMAPRAQRPTTTAIAGCSPTSARRWARRTNIVRNGRAVAAALASIRAPRSRRARPRAVRRIGSPCVASNERPLPNVGACPTNPIYLMILLCGPFTPIRGQRNRGAMSNDGDSLDSKKLPRKSKVRVTPVVRPRRMRASTAPRAAAHFVDEAPTREEATPSSDASAITIPPTVVTVAPSVAPETATPDAPTATHAATDAATHAATATDPATPAATTTDAVTATTVTIDTTSTAEDTVRAFVPALRASAARMAATADLEEHHAFFDAAARDAAEARRVSAETTKDAPRADVDILEARAAVATVERRRAELTKYVRAAVAFAALLCLAA